MKRILMIATGGTIEAIVKLIEQLGGVVVKAVFLMELEGLEGREKLSKYRTLEKLCDSLPETQDSKEEKDFIKAQIQNCKTSIQMYLRKAAEYQKDIKSCK